MILMASLLVIGSSCLICFFVSHGHRFRRAAANISSEEEATLRSITDRDGDLRRQLIANLSSSEQITRVCIERWQKERTALLPGAGAKWTADELKRRRREEFGERLGVVKQQALRHVAIGATAIVSVTLMLLLAAYWRYAGQSSPAILDTTSQQIPTTNSAFDQFMTAAPNVANPPSANAGAP